MPHHASSLAPPLSPTLFLGMALRPVPLTVLQPLFRSALRALDQRHPEIAARMQAQGQPAIAVEPTDLPFHFLLHFATEGPNLTLFGADERPRQADTVFRGPFAAFIALIEGDLDGDALFFSRTIGVEGDMEVALAFRNAIEGAEIDFLQDMTDAFGFLAGPARAMVGAAQRLLQRAGGDLGIVQAALLAPLERQLSRQAAEIVAIRAEITERSGQSGHARNRREPAGSQR